MAETYTVKSGDTLSGIGQKYGLNYGQSVNNSYISGYSSGNPNLIRPGEVLTINTASGSKPSASPAPGGVSLPSPAPAASPTPRVDFAQQLSNDALAKDAQYKAQSDAARQKLIDAVSATEKPSDAYSRIRKEQGVDTQQSLVDALTKDVMSSQDLIDGMEGSVNERTRDYLVTDSDRTAILARERDPLEKNLTKLLRAKQYEEVGLAGKQSLVSEMVKFAMQDAELKLKPLQLGVDYSDADRKFAADLVTSLFGTQVNAYSADLSAADARAENEKSRLFTTEQNDKKFANDIALENIRSANNIKEKSIPSQPSEAETKKVKQDQATQVFNQYLGTSETEGDVWEKIVQNEKALQAQGIDVGYIWQLHDALRAKIGQHGYLRDDGL